MPENYEDLLKRLSEARSVQARTAQRCDELRSIIEDVLQGGDRFPPGARTGPQIRKFLKDRLASFDRRHSDGHVT